MPNLADVIENFIKAMFDEGSNILEIQRNELASKFRCAPSQINYVLTTRFTLERGYIVESRRGGGGYIRIKKLKIRDDEFLREIIELVGDSISSSRAGDLVEFMLEEGIISRREAELFRAAINRKNLDVPLPERDRLRARLLKAMVAALLGYEENKGARSL
ncbi:CtsR family transcriptional regulator [Thermosediminibacter oceani]|uniref:Transcriptional regulator CtsR n=1 Tax=Thermosediminibacter oceani (strain ATCC BAA-1034 / DSM 16646 / JW/IW-1228P) TaxID=555079 RepID=D9S0I2_THEOJ|nr:CtsR family transcriptional regulator [Thermosediminibacter oceani]ADL08840.1 transcriptional regulator [Thermosediminibacter oceani DSM 16646]